MVFTDARGNCSLLASVETYQRGVLTLIRASGARIGILRDQPLLAKWQQYSQEHYGRTSVEADREEVFRFAAWTNRQPGINEEILAALPDSVRGTGRLCVPRHNVRVWGGTRLAERRLA